MEADCRAAQESNYNASSVADVRDPHPLMQLRGIFARAQLHVRYY